MINVRVLAVLAPLLLMGTASPGLAWDKFCSSTPHSVDGRYPTLGQASRLGYCERLSDGSFRFEVQPFDIRTQADTSKPSGGAEIGELPVLADDKTHAFQWDLRIKDLSMLQRGLVAHVELGHQHTRDGIPCGDAPAASSPSPGLDLAMVGDQVQFSLYFKPIYNRIPEAFLPYADRQCAADPDKPCNTTLWRGTYPIADILDQKLRVRLKIKFAQSEGTLSFAFGDQSLTSGELKFSQRTLKNGEQVVVAPTTVNQCRYSLHLGVYAQGYNRDYFGTAAGREINGPSWVSQRFLDEYGQFIDGSHEADELPPSVAVDISGVKIR